jgi:putative hydrolase of the HAD superfamily
MYAAGLSELGLPSELAAPMAMYGISASSTWVLDPGAIPVLRQLRERGYKIGLVSNWDGTLAATCSELGLTPYVDYVGDSTVFGRSKPDPSFFLHVLDMLGVRPEHAFHVGDHYAADVEGARAAGITPILIDILGHDVGACEHSTTDLHNVLRLAHLLSR